MQAEAFGACFTNMERVVAAGTRQDCIDDTSTGIARSKPPPTSTAQQEQL
jgi:hypothetical protein